MKRWMTILFAIPGLLFFVLWASNVISTRTCTVGELFSVAILLIGWDLVVVGSRGTEAGDTISEVTMSFTRRHSVAACGVSLALGIILGHVGWAQEIRVPCLCPPPPHTLSSP
jgi:hypothetical protein